jgi:hypothetical protein
MSTNVSPSKKYVPVFWLVLALIGGTAFGISHIKDIQKMGAPGIKATVIEGSQRMNLFFPEQVLNYEAKPVEVSPSILRDLPHDTSFLQCYYLPDDYASNNIFQPIQMNMVLMGTDRTSIHKPEFCLTGQGWPIDSTQSGVETIHIRKPHPYDLEVMKFLTTRHVTIEGKDIALRGVYMFWFVADNDLTAKHNTRMWHSVVNLLKKGELERWAYVSFFNVCLPGQEEATVEKMKKFIATAAPKFMLATNPETPQPVSPSSPAPQAQ